MTLYCIICASRTDKNEEVNEAIYVVNGHSICLEHFNDVVPSTGATSVTLTQKAKS